MANAIEFWRPIINDFNPVGPARLEDVRRFYVDRSYTDPTRSLVRRLTLTFQNNRDQPKPYKALLTGHVGSGKSTELKQLGEELAEDFLVIWFDAESTLVMETTNHFDVLLAMGLAVHKAAQMADLNPPDRLANALVKNLAEFVRNYEDRKGFSLKLKDLINQVTAVAIGAGMGALGAPPVAPPLELNIPDHFVKSLERPSKPMDSTKFPPRERRCSLPKVPCLWNRRAR
ncbi:MAG: hypothetical protein L0229_28455 [Blastocatellia bacterium]|nr:hypothetical protein [Blastocatellia bacterium]